MATIEQKLDQYAEMKSHADLLRLDYEARKALILATVQEQLDDLAAEYSPNLEMAAANMTLLEAEIKAEVKTRGASVKGSFFQAVFTKGRESWDAKSLTGYAAGHPEILPFRTVGEPSVSLRANGK